jgi:hypothetical protein
VSNHAKLACNPGITAQVVWRLTLLLWQRFLTLWGHVPHRVGVPISFGDTDEKTHHAVEMGYYPFSQPGS